MKQPQTKPWSKSGIFPIFRTPWGSKVEFFTEKFKTMWCGSPRKSAVIGASNGGELEVEDLASDFFLKRDTLW
jgi:hypothetical protein